MRSGNFVEWAEEKFLDENKRLWRESFTQVQSGFVGIFKISSKCCFYFKEIKGEQEGGYLTDKLDVSGCAVVAQDFYDYRAQEMQSLQQDTGCDDKDLIFFGIDSVNGKVSKEEDVPPIGGNSGQVPRRPVFILDSGNSQFQDDSGILQRLSFIEQMANVFVFDAGLVSTWYTALSNANQGTTEHSCTAAVLEHSFPGQSNSTILNIMSRPEPEKNADDASSQPHVLERKECNLVLYSQTRLPTSADPSANVSTITAAVSSAVRNAIVPIQEGGQLGGVVAQPPSSSWTLLNMMCRPEVAAMSGAFLAFGLLILATGGSSLVVAGGSSLLVKIGITSSVIGAAGLAGHFFAKKSQLPSESVANLLPPPPSPSPYSVG